MTRIPSRAFASLASILSLACLGGCSLVHGPSEVVISPASVVSPTGSVHGGQQPITGSSIQLYAVGTTGYGSAATALISTTVTTSDGTGLLNSNANVGNANNTLAPGSFVITGDYICPTPSTLVYLLASGGNPGLTAGTNNSAIVLMTALGPCGSLTPTTFISVNEVTTVASAFALANFASFNGNIGYVSGSPAGIVNAFANVNNLVNITTGTALATDAAGNAVPQSEINTFADTVVPCINSAGPSSSDCSALINAVFSGLTPQTVLAALFDLALFPNTNTTNLFNLSTANSPFQPTLTSAPHNWTLTVGGGGSLCGYSGAGNIVSGTISYSGTRTGRIYLALSNNNCSGGGTGTLGVSISSKGAYSIRGVPPGTYTLHAFMDTQGYGAQNAANPSGSSTVTLSGSSNLGNQNVTLVDPATVTVTSAPSLQTVNPFNTGVAVQFNAIKNNGVEVPSSYTLQWSTTSSFAAIAGSKTFPAVGSETTIWLVNGLADGSVYYFRAYGTSAGTAVGPSSTAFGPVTIGLPSTGSSVSGAVSFSGSATGPMYVGLHNQYTNTAYLQYLSSPVSAQAYTVVAPNSATAVYQPFAIIDQNNDGTVDAGDSQNTDVNGTLLAVTGGTANVNQTLPTGNSIATVSTQHYSSGFYVLRAQISAGTKLPVAVSLLSSSNADGANVVGPIDVPLCGQSGTNCGHGFQIDFDLGITVPTVGDTYFFSVTYSDGTTETVTGAVTAVLNTFATNLAPTTGTSTSTTPTFTWSGPVCGACSSYVYRFLLGVTNGNTIWQVPGGSNGLPYATTSLVWNVDPTASTNTPSVGSLTLGTNYSWSITVVDSNGNEAITQVNYTP